MLMHVPLPKTKPLVTMQTKQQATKIGFACFTAVWYGIGFQVLCRVPFAAKQLLRVLAIHLLIFLLTVYFKKNAPACASRKTGI